MGDKKGYGGYGERVDGERGMRNARKGGYKDV